MPVPATSLDVQAIDLLMTPPSWIEDRAWFEGDEGREQVLVIVSQLKSRLPASLVLEAIEAALYTTQQRASKSRMERLWNAVGYLRNTLRAITVPAIQAFRREHPRVAAAPARPVPPRPPAITPAAPAPLYSAAPLPAPAPAPQPSLFAGVPDMSGSQASMHALFMCKLTPKGEGLRDPLPGWFTKREAERFFHEVRRARESAMNGGTIGKMRDAFERACAARTDEPSSARAAFVRHLWSALIPDLPLPPELAALASGGGST